MEDLACPRCKTTKYRNPSLKLMVNICGHALCENCVELLFVKGSAACPECQISLRRGNFRMQLFEDPLVEKEVDIRKRVVRDFNKREEDFETLREYNDYLEEIENIVFNLTNNVDVEVTKKKIEQYKKDNKALIIRNKSKLSKDEEYLEDLIDNEQQENVFRRQLVLKEEIEEKRLKTKFKEALIDELMFSDAPAGEILASHVALKVKSEPQKETQKPTAHTRFSSGIKLRHAESFLPIPKREEVPLYEYRSTVRDLCGPLPPSYDALQTKGYLDNTKSANESEKASGFLSNIACYRALEEALCGLYCGAIPET